MTRLIQVTPADAKGHKLPAVEFSLDLADTGLGATAFPEVDVYLRLSGPPGGVLAVEVLPFQGDAGSLEERMRARFTEPYYQPLVFGQAAQVTLAGAARPALPMTTGQGLARTAWCGAVVASPRGGMGGLLVLWGQGTSPTAPPTCELATEPWLIKVLGTFKLGAEPAPLVEHIRAPASSGPTENEELGIERPGGMVAIGTSTVRSIGISEDHRLVAASTKTGALEPLSIGQNTKYGRRHDGAAVDGSA